ncbi:tetratricopeptide repeat protein [Leptothoe sp. EHU-05/26/07-4]
MSDSIYSRIIFVGREKELAWLTQMMEASLSDPDPQWMLSIQADGGMGKTQLLKQFVELAQAPQGSTNQRILITQYPIDLYLTSHQTERGILRSIAAQLTTASKAQPFAPFFKDLDYSFQATKDDIEHLRSSFLDCYNTLDTERIILLFDTIELANQAVQRFFREMLPQLGPQQQRKFKPLVITAGRKPLTDYCQHPQISPLKLQGLSPKEIRHYFDRSFQTQSAPEITQEFIDRITKLSQGAPILVALTIDWLNYGSLPEELNADSPEEFKQMMIELISELRNPEDQTILAMAQLKRRFDAGLLVEILGESLENASALIKSVSKFSFVKSHYNTNGEHQSCLLHDEMQRLVYDYIWQPCDPDNRLRREWSAKAVEYYNHLIAAEKNQVFKQSLQLEQLYYALYADKDQGLDRWRSLLKQANINGFKEALNEEVQQFKGQLNNQEKQELALAWATLAYDKGQYQEARQGFEDIFEQPLSKVIQSQVRPNLVFTYAHLNNFAVALEIGQQSLDWFRSELNFSQCTHWEKQQLLQDFGKTLNAMGWTHRRREEFDQAIDYYKQSLDKLKDIPTADLDRASTKTNLAYLFHAKGKNREAIAHSKSALKIAKRSGNSKQLGLTHNVLGIIAANSLQEHKATLHFKAAFEHFSEIDYDRGLAMVNIAHGRLSRQSGWNKVKPNRANATTVQADYEKAMTMFDQAIEYCQQKYEKLLIEAYNEKGTLLREQGKFLDALGYYQKSQVIAEKLNDLVWQIDNLQDTGVALYLQGDLEQAKTISIQAKQLAEKKKSPHLMGRVQRTLSNILFDQGKYPQSLEMALQSYINILELDQCSLNNSNSPAVRELLIEEWLTWLTEDLLEKIEDSTLKKKQCQYLLDYWRELITNDHVLVDHYPGFIITLEDLLSELKT